MLKSPIPKIELTPSLDLNQLPPLGHELVVTLLSDVPSHGWHGPPSFQRDVLSRLGGWDRQL